MKLKLAIRKVHKWIGLIIGIQVVLWFASGFIMSFFDINEVRGDHLLKPVEISALELNKLVGSMALVDELVDEDVFAVEAKYLMDRQVLQVQTSSAFVLIDIASGKVISPLSEHMVKKIVDYHYAGNASIKSINFLYELPGEVRGRDTPIWQVQFADDDNSRIYLSPDTGKIVGKRTDLWRLFDFFWMLHIMDYGERSDFNHPLLYLAALIGLFLSLSGVWMLIYTIRLKTRKTS